MLSKDKTIGKSSKDHEENRTVQFIKRNVIPVANIQLCPTSQKKFLFISRKKQKRNLINLHKMLGFSFLKHFIVTIRLIVLLFYFFQNFPHCIYYSYEMDL